MPAHLPGDEVLTDVILEGLIGEKVDITHAGVSQCDLIVVDVSNRSVWVKRGPNGPEREQVPHRIPLEDILTISYVEKVNHRYVAPEMVDSKKENH